MYIIIIIITDDAIGWGKHVHNPDFMLLQSSTKYAVESTACVFVLSEVASWWSWNWADGMKSLLELNLLKGEKKKDTYRN